MSEKTPEDYAILAEGMATKAQKEASKLRERILKKREKLGVEELKLSNQREIDLGGKPFLTATIKGHEVAVRRDDDGHLVCEIDREYFLKGKYAENFYNKHAVLDWEKHDQRAKDKINKEQEYFEEREFELRAKKIEKDLGLEFGSVVQ